MAIYEKFNQFVEDLAHGVHNLGSDQLEVALCPNEPSATLDVDRADLIEVSAGSYTNLTTRNITTISSDQSGGLPGQYDLVLQDLTITSSGVVDAFQYVIVFNQASSTPTADRLICYFDYGQPLTLASGESLTIDFESDGPPNGSLLTLQ
jgi:hypothetical protein